MTGALEKELNTYIKKLNTDQKKSLLLFIKTIFSGKEDTVSVEQYNKELEDAEAEIERGESFTHKEALDIFKKVIHAPR